MDEVVRIVATRGPGCTDSLPVPVDVVRHDRLAFWGMPTRALNDLVDELRRHEVQLLHAMEGSLADVTAQLAQRLGVPCVISSYALGDGQRLAKLNCRFQAVLAASDPVRCDLLEHHAAPADRIILMRPGVYQVRHTSLFENPAHSTAIVAGGDVEDLPAYVAVLRAFAELCEWKYDCTYFVIGAGRAEKTLRRLAEKLGLRTSLTFVDRQQPTQLAGIFKAADIYISPAPLDRVNMDALLAMASGDPVLAARGGCDDFLVNGGTALMFGRGNATELAGKLRWVLDNHAQARALAEGALDFLRKNHSPAVMVGALAGLYRQVIASPGASSS